MGEVSDFYRRALVRQLILWQQPVFLEPLSGLRGREELIPFSIKNEKTLAQFKKFDGVIRFGRTPVLKYWRELESTKLPVFSVSDLPFSGLSYDSHPSVAFEDFFPLVEGKIIGEDLLWTEELFLKDNFFSKELSKSLSDNQELSWFRRLSEAIPAKRQCIFGE